ncbi:MAG: ATP-binding domain-containing protein [Proteobacteria bacterium]|nr:ATP-binding domain-containing protein [Pseudomonadota bacterium]
MTEKENEVHSIVREEESALADIQLRLKNKPPEAEIDADAIRYEMESLREQIREANHDERPSLLMQYERLGHLLDAQGRSLGKNAVDPSKPYFGHMRLQEGKKVRDVYLGKATRLDHGLRIVDWRHAPVSRIFYKNAEGDEYDEDFGDREVSGEVLVRRTVGIREGAMMRVQAPQGVFVRQGEGWKQMADALPKLRGGEGAAHWIQHDDDHHGGGTQLGSGDAYRVDKHLPEISALIDKEQWELISADDAELVVIRGVAGSGKTTVALHRLAYLNFQDRRRFRPDRMMVVVWGDALRRFISKVLPDLGVHGTPVRTYGYWAGGIRKRLFPFLPSEQADDTPAIVTRFKLHPVMLRILEAYVKKTPGKQTARQAVEDWMYVITDLTLLKKGVKKWAPGAFSDAELDRITGWTIRQMDLVDEHLDPSPDPELDEPDAADEIHEEAFLDAEDDPMLLRLYQLRVGALPARGRNGRPLRYSHLVVDEVQDLSPLEVRVLMDCTDERRSMTLAGDTQQHVLQEAGFTNWEEFFGHLGVKGTSVNTLKIAYRSTHPIIQFARHVLGNLAEDESVEVARGGVPVEILPFEDDGECLAFLAESLRELAEKEPYANVALLARDPATALMYHDGLERAGVERLKYIRNQEFSFTAGVEVTDVTQAKGLEFDYVVLLDVSAAAYPDTSAARRILHVGATRAAHQLWVTTIGRPSPLLPVG